MKQLESIFRKHSRELFACALSITKNSASAEDTVHEALIAVASLKEAPRDLAAYLFRVVRNKALHHLKQSYRHQTLEEDFLEISEHDAEQNMLIEQVKQHIQQLDSNQQQVLILKLFEDLTFDEIARIMDSSPNTVASWYRRGLIKLKELLHE